MKKFFLVFIALFLLSASGYPQPEVSDISSRPGTFSRMGFGARGIGMGNAMSAVNTGNLVSYYNPAVSAFQENNYFQAGYSFLTLDRSLNFVNFTKKFNFYSKDSSTVRSSAGLSLGIINSGVSKIDSRDNEGNQGSELSTSETQYFLALANRFSDKLSIGVAVKFYYYKLYEEIHSSAVGIDLGAFYKISEKFSAALVIKDLNSKYKWDTSPIYGSDGSNTTDKFPLLKTLALSYFDKELKLLADAEVEFSNYSTNIFKIGAEYNIYDGLFLRAGVDDINLGNKDYPVKPSAGFSYYTKVSGICAGIDYAFQIEPYSNGSRHIVGLNILF